MIDRRRCVLLAFVALLLIPASGGATGRGRSPRGFPLFTANNVLLRGNRVICNINSLGEQCVDPSNSAVFAGSSWPGVGGSQYVFNGGLQVAAMVGGVDQPNFPWPGDTVGAFFFDPRGSSQHGARISGIYSSAIPLDRLDWPGAAYANDPLLYHPLVLGRAIVSDQDTWLRYWDGNTNLVNGRPHAAGLLVEQRTLSFSRPGLEDVIFFVHRLVNVSARDPAAYAGLSAAGYGPAEIAELARVGAAFQDAAEPAYSVQIPDGGFTLVNLFVGFAQDPDVSASAGTNFSSANLVFEAALAYAGSFPPSGFEDYPLEVFSDPFAVAPGFVMNAWIRTPRVGAGPPAAMSVWSNTTGGGGLPDHRDVQQLWRRLSLNMLPSDGTCSVANPQARRFCFATQTVADTRYFMATGPISSLAPGASATFVMVQVHAAAVLAPLQARGWPSMPPLGPGLPLDGARLVAGTDTVRTIDRVAGWLSHADTDGDGAIEPNEVVTQRHSLYGNLQYAAAIASNGFLVAGPPEGPAFFAVPGDNKVTIVWERSLTEATGDPFFALAADPLSAAYDPNFRQNDVEGYRIWRGTSPATMQVIADFDYSTTAMNDYTGRFQYGTQCAPELGVTTTCPAFPQSHPLAGNVIQIPYRGRVLLAGNAVGVLRADTAVTGRASGRLGPRDTGVPFAFVDTEVENGRQYLYAVTAYDVNSVASGPTSLESAPAPRLVRPRVASRQAAAGLVSAPYLLGGDSTVLDTGLAMPTLDRFSAIFSGPMPPTNGLDLRFLEFVPELVDSGAVTVTIDSLVPGGSLSLFRPGTYYVTAQGVGQGSAGIAFQMDYFDQERTGAGTFAAALTDSAQVARFGATTGAALEGSLTIFAPGGWRLASWGRASLNSSPPGSDYNGPRWWSGAANENRPDPNGLRCAPAIGTCVQADLSRNAGGLTGVSTLFHISGYSTVPSVPLREIEAISAFVTRAADFRVHWGANGFVDSVVDLTHRVRVEYSRSIRSTWGFLTDSSFVATPAASTRDGSNALLTWSDIACVDPVPRLIGNVQSGGFPANCGGPTTTAAALMPRARLSPVAAMSSTWPNASTLTQTGTGFIMYLNGHFFLMQMAALPAAGTVWNARFYAGTVTGLPGTYAFLPARRPPAVPGLRIQMDYTGSTFNPGVTADSQLARVHTVPDPYYLGNSLEGDLAEQRLRFVNLPARAIVRIYSSSGILVALLNHNDPGGGGEAWWDLRNRGGRRVGSGVYFYHVETPDGRRRVGRFVVVNRR